MKCKSTPAHKPPVACRIYAPNAARIAPEAQGEPAEMSIQRENDEQGLRSQRRDQNDPPTLPPWAPQVLFRLGPTLSLMLGISAPDLEKMVSSSMKLCGYVGRRG